jgi:hypothetical protein
LKFLSATVVATITFYLADQLLWAGRHSNVLAEVLRQAGLFFGIHA